MAVRNLRLDNGNGKWIGLGLLVIASTLTGCAGSSGSSTAAPTSGTVSGTLTQTAASEVGNPVSQFEASFATTGTTVSLDCGVQGIFTATVNSATGAFTATGVPTGVPCSFNFVNSTSGVNKCQVQFQDPTNYDLNHNQLSANSSSISGSLALGAITCDTSGTIGVPVSSVTGLSSGANLSSATAFNFTGIWTAAAYTGTLPTGYQTITNCTSNCNGPGIGQVISLVRFHGVQFTPASGQCTPAFNVTCPVSAGTDNTAKEGYAMSIWGGDYAHGIGACGGKTGFTTDEARAYANLDLDATPPSLSGNVLSYGHYVWSTGAGFGTDTGWTEPWMYGGATAQFSVQDCQPVTVPSTASGVASKPGMACFSQIQSNSGTPTGVYVWSVSLQNTGGCVDASGNPLMVNNWSAVTNGTCTNTASSFNTSMSSSSCTYTAPPQAGQASQTFTCSNSFGTFNDISTGTSSSSNNGPNFSSAYTMPMNDWPAPPATILAQGAACKDSVYSEATLIAAATGGSATAAAAASKELLYRYQCYANAYWQHSSSGSGSTSCLRDYNFNWSTNNYANFVLGDDRSMKPQNAFITDRVFYSSDGTWAFLKNTDVKYQSIPTATGSTLCPMSTVVTMKIQDLSAAQLLVNFVQQTTVTDTSANCQGAVAAALAGGGTVSPDPTGLNNLYQNLQTARMVFLMNKSSN